MESHNKHVVLANAAKLVYSTILYWLTTIALRELPKIQNSSKKHFLYTFDNMKKNKKISYPQNGSECVKASELQ